MTNKTISAAIIVAIAVAGGAYWIGLNRGVEQSVDATDTPEPTTATICRLAINSRRSAT